jgi:hypothetical protein
MNETEHTVVRKILHIDMDTFYVGRQRNNPALRGKTLSDRRGSRSGH